MADKYCGACGTEFPAVENTFCVRCGKKMNLNDKVISDVHRPSTNEPLSFSNFVDQKKEERNKRFCGSSDHMAVSGGKKIKYLKQRDDM